MPHIEEGQLHALLDGAYRHDSAEAAGIRSHLSGCADCRALLEAERSVRDRANELLDFARPLPDDTPPFEVILERAKSNRKPLLFPPARLAWAASIALAVGLGWFSRDLVSRRDAQLASQAEESAAAEPMTMVPAPIPAPAEAPIESPRLGAAGAAVGKGIARDRTETDLAAPPTRESALQLQDVAARVDSLKQGAELRQRAEQQAANKMAAPPPAAPLPVASAAREASGVVGGRATGRVTAAGSEWTEVTLDLAEKNAGRRVLLVPGLELVRLEVRSSAEGQVMRATQRIPGDGTIELLQEPVRRADERAEANRLAPQAAPAPAAASLMNSVSIVVGEVRITGRAQLSADSLRILLAKVR